MADVRLYFIPFTAIRKAFFSDQDGFFQDAEERLRREGGQTEEERRQVGQPIAQEEEEWAQDPEVARTAANNRH